MPLTLSTKRTARVGLAAMGPWWLILPPQLRRWLGLCSLELHVELTQAGAASLDAAAILGLGHDRDRLEHNYFIECGTVHRADCPLLARIEQERKTWVSVLVREPFRPRLKFHTPGQAHLFDRHGYAPGVYEIDKELERSVLTHLQARNDLPTDGSTAVGDHGVDHTKDRAEQRDGERHVAHPTNRSHPSAP